MSELKWASLDRNGQIALRLQFPDVVDRWMTTPEAEELYAQLGKAIDEAKKRKKNGPFEKWWESLERCRCGNPSCDLRFIGASCIGESDARYIWESMQKAMKEEG